MHVDGLFVFGGFLFGVGGRGGFGFVTVFAPGGF
jgi:hypothetical protein